MFNVSCSCESPVYEALAEHQVASDWEFRDLLKELHRWAEILNFEFKLEIPEVALCVDRLRVSRLGHFRFGRNGFGLRGEIALNERHLRGREFWQVLGTLDHELLHAWQQAYGKAGKNNYYKKQYREHALRHGLIVDARGHTSYLPASQFMTLLRKYGVAVLALTSLDTPRRVQGTSKLRLWTCGCTRVRVADADFRARWLRCCHRFQLADSTYGENPTVTIFHEEGRLAMFFKVALESGGWARQRRRCMPTYKSFDDDQLWKAVLDGDTAALVVLVERMSDLVTGHLDQVMPPNADPNYRKLLEQLIRDKLIVGPDSLAPATFPEFVSQVASVLAPISSDELMNRVRDDSDREAYKELWLRWNNWLTNRVINKFGCRVEDAEDTAQEAWMRVWNKRYLWNPPPNEAPYFGWFPHWLFKIASRIHLDRPDPGAALIGDFGVINCEQIIIDTAEVILSVYHDRCQAAAAQKIDEKTPEVLRWRFWPPEPFPPPDPRPSYEVSKFVVEGFCKKRPTTYRDVAAATGVPLQTCARWCCTFTKEVGDKLL